MADRQHNFAQFATVLNQYAGGAGGERSGRERSVEPGTPGGSTSGGNSNPAAGHGTSAAVAAAAAAAVVASGNNPMLLGDLSRAFHSYNNYPVFTTAPAWQAANQQGGSDIHRYGGYSGFDYADGSGELRGVEGRPEGRRVPSKGETKVTPPLPPGLTPGVNTLASLQQLVGGGDVYRNIIAHQYAAALGASFPAANVPPGARPPPPTRPPLSPSQLHSVAAAQSRQQQQMLLQRRQHQNSQTPASPVQSAGASLNGDGVVGFGRNQAQQQQLSPVGVKRSADAWRPTAAKISPIPQNIGDSTGLCHELSAGRESVESDISLTGSSASGEGTRHAEGIRSGSESEGDMRARHRRKQDQPRRQSVIYPTRPQESSAATNMESSSEDSQGFDTVLTKNSLHGEVSQELSGDGSVQGDADMTASSVSVSQAMSHALAHPFLAAHLNPHQESPQQNNQVPVQSATPSASATVLMAPSQDDDHSEAGSHIFAPEHIHSQPWSMPGEQTHSSYAEVVKSSVSDESQTARTSQINCKIPESSTPVKKRRRSQSFLEKDTKANNNVGNVASLEENSTISSSHPQNIVTVDGVSENSSLKANSSAVSGQPKINEARTSINDKIPVSETNANLNVQASTADSRNHIGDLPSENPSSLSNQALVYECRTSISSHVPVSEAETLVAGHQLSSGESGISTRDQTLPDAHRSFVNGTSVSGSPVNSGVPNTSSSPSLLEVRNEPESSVNLYGETGVHLQNIVGNNLQSKTDVSLQNTDVNLLNKADVNSQSKADVNMQDKIVSYMKGNSEVSVQGEDDLQKKSDTSVQGKLDDDESGKEFKECEFVNGDHEHLDNHPKRPRKRKSECEADEPSEQLLEVGETKRRTRQKRAVSYVEDGTDPVLETNEDSPDTTPQKRKGRRPKEKVELEANSFAKVSVNLPLPPASLCHTSLPLSSPLPHTSATPPPPSSVSSGHYQGVASTFVNNTRHTYNTARTPGSPPSKLPRHCGRGRGRGRPRNLVCPDSISPSLCEPLHVDITNPFETDLTLPPPPPVAPLPCSPDVYDFDDADDGCADKSLERGGRKRASPTKSSTSPEVSASFSPKLKEAVNPSQKNASAHTPNFPERGRLVLKDINTLLEHPPEPYLSERKQSLSRMHEGQSIGGISVGTVSKPFVSQGTTKVSNISSEGFFPVKISKALPADPLGQQTKSVPEKQSFQHPEKCGEDVVPEPVLLKRVEEESTRVSAEQGSEGKVAVNPVSLLQELSVSVPSQDCRKPSGEKTTPSITSSLRGIRLHGPPRNFGGQPFAEKVSLQSSICLQKVESQHLATSNNVGSTDVSETGISVTEKSRNPVEKIEKQVDEKGRNECLEKTVEGNGKNIQVPEKKDGPDEVLTLAGAETAGSSGTCKSVDTSVGSKNGADNPVDGEKESDLSYRGRGRGRKSKRGSRRSSVQSSEIGSKSSEILIVGECADVPDSSVGDKTVMPSGSFGSFEEKSIDSIAECVAVSNTNVHVVSVSDPNPSTSHRITRARGSSGRGHEKSENVKGQTQTASQGMENKPETELGDENSAISSEQELKSVGAESGEAVECPLTPRRSRRTCHRLEPAKDVAEGKSEGTKATTASAGEDASQQGVNVASVPAEAGSGTDGQTSQETHLPGADLASNDIEAETIEDIAKFLEATAPNPTECTNQIDVEPAASASTASEGTYRELRPKRTKPARKMEEGEMNDLLLLLNMDDESEDEDYVPKDGEEGADSNLESDEGGNVAQGDGEFGSDLEEGDSRSNLQSLVNLMSDQDAGADSVPSQKLLSGSSGHKKALDKSKGMRLGSAKKGKSKVKRKILKEESERKRDERLERRTPYVRTNLERCWETIVNTQYQDDDMYMRLLRKSNIPFHSEVEALQRSAKVGFTSTLHNNYDAFTKDLSWYCTLCKQYSHQWGLGDLFGPFFIKDVAVTKKNYPEVVEGQVIEKPSSITEASAAVIKARSSRRASCHEAPADSVAEAKRGRSGVKEASTSRLAERLVPSSSTGTCGTAEAQRSASREPMPGTSQADSALASRPPGTECWIHESCLLWASGVHVVNSKLCGLEDALVAAQDSICSHCGETGATVGCLGRGCRMLVHFPCAQRLSWTLDTLTFMSLCPRHKVVT